MARKRFLRCEGRPVFLSDWREVLMMHFRVDRAILQAETPFVLDLHDGDAYVSLVAFRMRRFRFARGGRLARWVMLPVAEHSFLNVRTYVVHAGEPGIYFLAEWLPNRLAVLLGPVAFGLPYRYGRLAYEHDEERGMVRGTVEDGTSRDSLRYSGNLDVEDSGVPCGAGTLAEFLMERYTAFTYWRGFRRMFRIWHEAWPQLAADVTIEECPLLERSGAWSRHSSYVGANYSTGVNRVWMGRPRALSENDLRF
ncbi:MAG: DUF2071 domain-containing protein [Planctomycetes bacterium]|nr:DUF2071 domain-containing protein [Planctomycetota bacterium]